MNRIQSKGHKIGTYETNKISLSCFDDKTYIQNNGCDGLALILITIKKVFLSRMFLLIFSLVRTASFLSSILNLKNVKHLKKS